MRKIDFFAHSFQGRRKNNEDNCLAIKLDKDNTLLAVADGMGGAAAGEIASEIAVFELQKFLKSSLQYLDEKSNRKQILKEAYSKIQQKIAAKNIEYPAYQGMGTTLSVIWFYKETYVWANLGDSRIYFLNEKVIQQITKDHTYIQDFKDKHGTEVAPEIAAQYGNLIMRSLDGGNDEPDIFPLNKAYEKLSANCAFLLCSDGLILDKLDNINTEFHKIFRQNKTLSKTVHALVNFAFAKGSTDNITVVVGEFGNIKRVIQPIKQILIFSLAAIFIGFSLFIFFNPRQIVFDNKVKNKQDSISKYHQSPPKKALINIDSTAYFPFNGRMKFSKFYLSNNELLVTKQFKLEGVKVIGYTYEFRNKENELVKSISLSPNEFPLHIGNNLKNLQNGAYKVAVYASLEDGRKKQGEFEQEIEIK